jgi:3-polyprenyl-4-hydroxybenzoate decarboxylase
LKKLIVGMSGSSGPIYGIRLLEVLKTISEVETHLVMSPYAKLNIEIETAHNAQYVEDLADVGTATAIRRRPSPAAPSKQTAWWSPPVP